MKVIIIDPIEEALDSTTVTNRLFILNDQDAPVFYLIDMTSSKDDDDDWITLLKETSGGRFFFCSPTCADVVM